MQTIASCKCLVIILLTFFLFFIITLKLLWLTRPGIDASLFLSICPLNMDSLSTIKQIKTPPQPPPCLTYSRHWLWEKRTYGGKNYYRKSYPLPPSCPPTHPTTTPRAYNKDKRMGIRINEIWVTSAMAVVFYFTKRSDQKNSPCLKFLWGGEKKRKASSWWKMKVSPSNSMRWIKISTLQQRKIISSS